MHPRVCICCGQAMESQTFLRNANLCVACAQADWTSESGWEAGEIPALSLAEVPPVFAASPPSSPLNEVPSELQHLIEMDEPNVVECLEAELAAKKAIAELAAREVKVLEQRLSSVARRSVRAS